MLIGNSAERHHRLIVLHNRIILGLISSEYLTGDFKGLIFPYAANILGGVL
jgi:hypothetical protein